jgi:ferritin-like metal-binding protein YciE
MPNTNGNSRDTLQKLYLKELRDLYNAEGQILEALPKMIQASSHADLKRGFQEHYQQTEQQLHRLEEIGNMLGENLGGHHCKGMAGLIKEGEEAMKEFTDSDVLDAALIGAAQRVEHYEMAGYGCARTYANMLGLAEQSTILQRTLDEEGETDKKLTELAETVVNIDALK